jgi:hypothetical protein
MVQTIYNPIERATADVKQRPVAVVVMDRDVEEPKMWDAVICWPKHILADPDPPPRKETIENSLARISADKRRQEII